MLDKDLWLAVGRNGLGLHHGEASRQRHSSGLHREGGYLAASSYLARVAFGELTALDLLHQWHRITSSTCGFTEGRERVLGFKQNLQDAHKKSKKATLARAGSHYRPSIWAVGKV